MKGALLFIAGLLVGANVVYFAMRGPAAWPTAAKPVASTTCSTRCTILARPDDVHRQDGRIR